MEKILKVKIPFSFEVLYLGKENQEITRSGDKYIYRIMLVAAKKAITKKWFKTDAPNREDWVEVTRLKTETFKNYWENWVNFVSPLRADFVQ